MTDGILGNIKDVLGIGKEVKKEPKKEEPKKEEPKKEIKEENINELKKEINEIDKEENVKDFARKFSKEKKLKDLTGKIKIEGVYEVNPIFIRGSKILDGNMLKRYYYKLIQEKTLKDDKTLMDDIIKNRKSILQHRICCEATFFGKGNIIAQIKIFKILIENGQEVIDFWLGVIIDPSSFKNQVWSFENKMKKYGTGNAEIISYPYKKEVIEDIKLKFTFS